MFAERLSGKAREEPTLPAPLLGGHPAGWNGACLSQLVASAAPLLLVTMPAADMGVQEWGSLLVSCFCGLETRRTTTRGHHRVSYGIGSLPSAQPPATFLLSPSFCLFQNIRVGSVPCACGLPHQPLFLSDLHSRFLHDGFLWPP